LNRRFALGLGLIGLALIAAGCDYSAKKPPVMPSGIVDGPLPASSGRPATETDSTFTNPDSDAPIDRINPIEVTRREAILKNVVNLINTASTNPGGQNFGMATDNLNELFDQGFKPSEFEYTEEPKRFLARKVAMLFKDPEPVLKGFTSPKFSIRDARHIEDCMLYHIVASRIAGEGDDLTRVRRIFEWIMRNIEVVPAESLSGNGLRQAQVRPADVLLRGMATEIPVEYGGLWSERGWLFMVLCRQIGIDVGLLTFTPPPPPLPAIRQANLSPVAWVTAAVIGPNLYLFDQRLGLEIPGPDGTGVATLEEALTDPIVLSRLDVPGSYAYGVSGAEIAASPTKISVLLDSSPGYFAQRMRLLQTLLKGEYRTILFRDMLEQAKNFAQALGSSRVGQINLWQIPIMIDQKLFTDGEFVRATQMPLQFFRGELPLLYARTKHLRGELEEATSKYVELRKRKDGVMKDAKKTPIEPVVQNALDIYSTLFLAQCHLDRGNTQQAEDLFKQVLAMTPEPGRGRNYYYMLRWNALSNLGRIAEQKGDRAGAIRYYTELMQPGERHGNLIKARKLLWGDPFVNPAPPLPPAPPVPVEDMIPSQENETKPPTESKPSTEPTPPAEPKSTTAN
jgi:hypothetical protein